MLPDMFKDQAISAESRSQSGGVGGDIRALRKSRKISLADLSAALGRSVGWLSQVERGLSEPAIQDLRAIAQFFEVPLSFFFRNEDAPKEERRLDRTGRRPFAIRYQRDRSRRGASIAGYQR